MQGAFVRAIGAGFYYRRRLKFPSAEGCRRSRRGGIVPHPPSHEVRHPPPRTTHANYVCAGPGVAVGIRVVVCRAYSLPCHCEGVRSTLKTLSCDCGNPGIICLRAFCPQCFLLLAMTRGSKWIISHSLTTPGYAHPSNGGELVPRRDEGKFLI